MTSNEHYGQLNERFDERAALLRSKSFTYQHCEILNNPVAVFVKPTPSQRKPTIVLAAFVMNADARSWDDKLAEVAQL